MNKGKIILVGINYNENTKNHECVILDFQGIGKSGFDTEEKFVQEFCRLTWKEEKEPVVRLGELQHNVCVIVIYVK